MQFGSRQYIDFILAMTMKEIKARYKRAVFGFLWVLLNPLLQMVVIGLVFSLFIEIPNYFIFLFPGLLLWTFFYTSLTKATPSIVYERALLQKAKFPIEAIPVSIILAFFLHTLVAFILYIPFLLVENTFVLPRLLLIIPALLWFLMLTIGLSLATSSLNVYFRDVNFFVQSILAVWFYGTPILYDLNKVPENLKYLFAINPLTSIFEISHIALLGQGTLPAEILFLNLIISLAILVFGLIVFKKRHRYFVDWL